MNIIKVNVNFKKGTCTKDERLLVSGDYNSTKLIFDFDVEDGTKIFELKGPDGALVFMQEIENNEVTLVGVDDEGQLCSIFAQAGLYVFEISLYKGDSRLTSAYNYIDVAPEQVVVDGKVLEYYLPIFDQWLRAVKESAAYAQEQGDYAKASGDYATEKGNFAKEQGEFAEEQANKVVEELPKVDEKVSNALKQAKDYADNLTIKDIKEVKYDETSAVFTFIRHDDTEIVVDLPIEELVDDIYYDDVTEEIVLVREGGSETRIPVTAFVKYYFAEDSDTIQLNLSNQNVFRAILKGQSVKKTHLDLELQEEINNKAESNIVSQELERVKEESNKYTNDSIQNLVDNDIFTLSELIEENQQNIDSLGTRVTIIEEKLPDDYIATEKYVDGKVQDLVDGDIANLTELFEELQDTTTKGIYVGYINSVTPTRSSIETILEDAINSGASTIMLRPTVDLPQDFTAVSSGPNLQRFKNGGSGTILFTDVNEHGTNNSMPSVTSYITTIKFTSTVQENKVDVTINDVTTKFVSGINSTSQHAYVLHTKNEEAYTPTKDYHPATKKYTDDAINNKIGDIDSILDFINGEVI